MSWTFNSSNHSQRASWSIELNAFANPSRHNEPAPVALQQCRMPTGSLVTEPWATSSAACGSTPASDLLGIKQAVPRGQWVQTICQDRRQNLVFCVKQAGTLCLLDAAYKILYER